MTVRLRGLGGLGEFGANSLLVDDGAAGRVLVDAGAAFADEPALGLSYEVPDFSAVAGPSPGLLVLSHAHDDHCKGLGVALRAWPGCRVAASRTTLAWCRPALSGAGVHGAELGTGPALASGGWQVDGLPVSHSIPGTLALRLRSEAASVVLASDLRVAPSALGEETSLDELGRWGGEGVDVLLLDSTNALVATPPPTETAVASALAELVRSTRGMAVAVTFASHLGRFRQVAMAALAAGRVVVPVGRGLVEALAVQARLGGIGLPLGLVRPARELPRLPRDGVVAVVTGSQGESGSAFMRLAAGHLAGLGLQAGDRVLHAARVIPGNERRLAGLFDLCVRQGAEVVTAAEAPIHASGHPHRQELETLLDAVRPRWVVPVHGWRRHLQEVADLVRHFGASAAVAENGEELVWSGGELELSGQRQPVGRLAFGDGDNELLDAGEVHTRRILARFGALVAVVVQHDGSLPSVQLHTAGLRLASEEVEELTAAVRGEAGRVLAGGTMDGDDASLTMERWLRRELRRRCGQRPAVVVSVVTGADRAPRPGAGRPPA
ncbi:MAG: ribonuclease J [Thermoanaerobaculaceae bacterium]|jgi:ribonuclease J|nr:ribonuclease J [Thermoanaerobaculaceae bacterium]